MLYIRKDVGERLDYAFVRESADKIISVSYTKDDLGGLVVDSASVNTSPLLDEEGNVYPIGNVITLWCSGGTAGTSEKVVLRYSTEVGRIFEDKVTFILVEEC